MIEEDFKAHDKNGDGLLDANEANSLLQHIGATEDEVSSLLQQAAWESYDLDKDRKLSLTELHHWWFSSFVQAYNGSSQLEVDHEEEEEGDEEEGSDEGHQDIEEEGSDEGHEGGEEEGSDEGHEGGLSADPHTPVATHTERHTEIADEKSILQGEEAVSLLQIGAADLHQKQITETDKEAGQEEADEKEASKEEDGHEGFPLEEEDDTDEDGEEELSLSEEEKKREKAAIEECERTRCWETLEGPEQDHDQIDEEAALLQLADEEHAGGLSGDPYTPVLVGVDHEVHEGGEEEGSDEGHEGGHEEGSDEGHEVSDEDHAGGLSGDPYTPKDGNEASMHVASKHEVPKDGHEVEEKAL